MNILEDTPLGEIVRINFNTAQVFEKFNIDFCCGGGISLAEACKNSNVDIELIINEINSLLQTSDPDSKYIESLEPDELCDYIESKHHKYILEILPFIQEKLEKLCDVHGDNHHELYKVRDTFKDGVRDIKTHMDREELFLFAYIRKMCEHKRNNYKTSNEFGDVKITLDTLLVDHQIEGVRFGKISKLTNGYKVPDDGCSTYQVTLQALKDFEKDLHRHIHLENNILFKKCQELENELI